MLHLTGLGFIAFTLHKVRKQQLQYSLLFDLHQVIQTLSSFLGSTWNSRTFSVNWPLKDGYKGTGGKPYYYSYFPITIVPFLPMNIINCPSFVLPVLAWSLLHLVYRNTQIIRGDAMSPGCQDTDRTWHSTFSKQAPGHGLHRKSLV